MEKISFFTGGPAQTHGYLIKAAGGYFAVDAPQGMASWLKGLGVRLEALLLTHQHFDHVWDAAELVAQHGCALLAFSEFDPQLTLAASFAKATGQAFEIAPFKVTRLLADGEGLELCAEGFKCLHVPGHSPDSLCFFHGDDHILLGGDVLFAGGVGRTDLPGGNMRQLLLGIERQLRPLPENTQVLPGHGPSTTLAEEWLHNPFLSAVD